MGKFYVPGGAAADKGTLAARQVYHDTENDALHVGTVSGTDMILKPSAAGVGFQETTMKFAADGTHLFTLKDELALGTGAWTIDSTSGTVRTFSRVIAGLTEDDYFVNTIGTKGGIPKGYSITEGTETLQVAIDAPASGYGFQITIRKKLA